MQDTQTEQSEVKPKVTLDQLLAALSYIPRKTFGFWAGDYQINARNNFLRRQREYQVLVNLGFPKASLQERADELVLWDTQLRQSEMLSLADSDIIELDYTNPVVLKYLALFLGSRNTEDKYPGKDGDALDLRDGPIYFEEFLAPDLLAAPAFNQL